MASLEVIASGPPEEAVAVLLAGLDDPNWSVRLTAVKGLVALRTSKAVPALISRLRCESGRMRLEIGEALTSLTGVGLPPDPVRWEAWWEKEREGFETPEAPKASARVGTAAGDSVVTFHSIPVTSSCVAFVLDRSRSMKDRLDRKGEETKGELVERELTRTLSRFPAAAHFLLVAFGTRVDLFRETPARNGRCTRRAALRWFGKRPAAGRTNLCDALTRALAEPAVDTIFVLTDGAPSAGEYRTRTGILAEVARRNRYRKAVIHTIEIGADATGRRWRGFLRQIAERNGGRHVRR